MSLGDAATAPENGGTVNLGLTNPQEDEMNAHVQEVLSSEVRAILLREGLRRAQRLLTFSC
jgi:hypothetical protein